MNKNIRDAMIEVISAEGGELKTPAGPYRGELEEGANWNPVLPIVFVQLIDFEPLGLLADNMSARKEYGISLMVAAKDDSSELAEKVFDSFDGAELTDNGKAWHIRAMKCELVGWIKSVEVHRVLLRVS